MQVETEAAKKFGTELHSFVVGLEVFLIKIPDVFVLHVSVADDFDVLLDIAELT